MRHILGFRAKDTSPRLLAFFCLYFQNLESRENRLDFHHSRAVRWRDK